MAGTWTLSEEAMQNLKAAMARARNKEEYRRALAVWLPVALGLSSGDVAKALGYAGAVSVRHMWQRYRRHGESAFQDRRPKLPADAVQVLGAAMKRVRTATECRRLLSVWLRLVLGFQRRQVAAALHWSFRQVAQAQADYFKRGMAGLWPEAGAQPADPELRAAMKGAHSVQEFRRALCLRMLEVGLSQKLVAQILFWHSPWVSQLHVRYRRQGAAMLRNPGRGGARARLLTPQQEAELLRELRRRPWRYGILRFREVQAAMEKLLNRPVKPSSVHAMLDRHGWSRDALVITAKNAPGISEAPVSPEEYEPEPLGWGSHVKTGPSEE